MKLSARNIFKGQVAALKIGPVSAEVTVKTDAGEMIVASITAASAQNLGLTVGGTAYAVIKASSVMVATDCLKISARNTLKGKVTAVKAGPVSAEVTIQTAAGETVVASITETSAENLGLAEGTEVCAIVKASSVMIAAE